jgi:hypothetical protein
MSKENAIGNAKNALNEFSSHSGPSKYHASHEQFKKQN